MQLEIKHLTKRYGDKTALDDFSYCFDAGIYGILGANGAGKTTLMNLITDNVRRDAGEILFNGTDVLKLGKRFRSVTDSKTFIGKNRYVVFSESFRGRQRKITFRRYRIDQSDAVFFACIHTAAVYVKTRMSADAGFFQSGGGFGKSIFRRNSIIGGYTIDK